jgi:hypothetical protein
MSARMPRPSSRAALRRQPSSARTPAFVLESSVPPTIRIAHSTLLVLRSTASVPGLALLVYPTLRGLDIEVDWEPRFFNIKTQIAASGAKIDLPLAANPLHSFTLRYNFLRDHFPRPGTSEGAVANVVGIMERRARR